MTLEFSKEEVEKWIRFWTKFERKVLCIGWAQVGNDLTFYVGYKSRMQKLLAQVPDTFDGIPVKKTMLGKQ